MRILHTIDSSGLYGAEMVLLTLAGEQQRRGDTPIIASIGNEHATTKALETEALGRDLPCVPFRMRDGLNLRGAQRLLRLADEHAVDVIHSHGYKSNILLALMPRRLRKRPIVSTLHGWTAKSAFSKLGLYKFLDQRLLSRLDAVIIVNERLRATAALANLGPAKVHSIANGIAIPAAPGEQLPDDPVTEMIRSLRARSDIVIGAVGRLSPEKNFGALVEAMREVANANPRVSAVLLGAGSEEVALRAQIGAAKLEQQVLLGGYVRDGRRYLPLFDALAIPSLTEGLPMVLLEAMTANLPVIATSVGDIPEVLGGHGTLVDAGNVPQLASAILSLAAEPARFRERATGSARRIMERYGSATMAARYDGVYRSVLGHA